MRTLKSLSTALAFVLASACASLAPSSTPLPEDGRFARVMPKAFAEGFAAGTGRIGGGAEVFVTAAADLAEVRTVRDAQQRLALYKDFEATQPNLLGDVVVKFRLRDTRAVGLRRPSRKLEDTNTGKKIPRGYGFKYGGRTGGGAREWVIKNGTAAEIGAYGIELSSLQP